MIKVFVNQSGNVGNFVGVYEDLDKAVIELAEARDDKDFSMTTFRECYKSQEVEGEFRTDYSYNKEFVYGDDIESFFDDLTWKDLTSGKDVENFQLQRLNLETGEYQDCDLDGQFI